MEHRSSPPGPEQHDAEIRRLHGRLAAFAWIGSALFLYVTSASAEILSVQAAFFVLIGVFAAALVFGNAGYWLQRGVVHLAVRKLAAMSTGAAGRVIYVVGIGLTILEVTAVFFVARWAFRLVNGHD